MNRFYFVSGLTFVVVGAVLLLVHVTRNSAYALADVVLIAIGAYQISVGLKLRGE